MKIAIVSTLLGEKWYGGEISSFLLAEILSRKEEVFVVTAKIKGKMPFKAYGMRLLKYVPNLALLIGHWLIDKYVEKQLERIFRKEKPEIVHLQDYSMMIPAIKVARKLGVPVVFTARSYQFMCNLSTCLEKNQLHFGCSRKQYQHCLKKSVKETYPSYFQLLQPLVVPWFYRQNLRIKHCFKQLDYIITVSDFVRNQIIKSGVDSTKIQTIKVPLDPDWQPIRKPTNPHPLIFTQGGLKKSKGFHFLIKAFRLVVDKHPDAVLRIAGEGSARPKLEQLVQQLNLTKNVFFLGKTEYHAQQKNEFAQADLVISPSLWPEPLSRGIFETFTMKKPLVSTAVGGSSELVKHNLTGLLVKPNDIKGMAGAIIQLIENPKLRDKLAKNAFRSIRKKCNEEKIYREHLKIYQNLCGNKSTQSNHQNNLVRL